MLSPTKTNTQARISEQSYSANDYSNQKFNSKTAYDDQF